MFDFSLAELLLVIVVAVIFIGPKDVPVIVRAIAKAMKSMKALSAELRKAFDELAEESGMKETAEELHQEIRLIKGDDGNFYESYDITTIDGSAKRGQ